MEFSVGYDSYCGAGGHNILSSLPFFLGLSGRDFGSAIQFVNATAIFRSDDADESNLSNVAFEKRLARKKLPSYRLDRKKNMLTIHYVSHVSCAEAYAGQFNALRYPEFTSEFREIMRGIRCVLKNSDDFDLDALLKVLDSNAKYFPTSRAEMDDVGDTYRKYSSEVDWSWSYEVGEYRGKGKVPELIPVSPLQEGKNMGRYGSGNQFWGQIVASSIRAADDIHERHWYSVVYKFDSNGNFLNLDQAYIGPDGEETYRIAREKLAEFLDRLENKTYESISIRQFSILVDDVLHGLFETSDSSGLELTMQPAYMVFNRPWNGYYST